MKKDKGLKHFNKFHGWARHEALVRKERATAQEEFFRTPQLLREDTRDMALALFEDWFLLDRPLTASSRTPLQQFLETKGGKLKELERLIYQAFDSENRFGLFEVIEAHPGDGLELKSIPEGGAYDVVDAAASRSAARGDLLATRIIPYGDYWLLPGFVCRLPDDGTGFLQQSLKNPELKKNQLRPRELLALFMKKVDWEEEGLDRVKARLASILQRWGVEDITVKSLEAAVTRAHAAEASLPAEFTAALAKAPDPSEAQELSDVLKALWNLSIPKQGGKTPKEAILKERLERGNPQSEVCFSFATPIKLDGSRWEEGARLSNRAQDKLLEGKSQEAAELYARAVGMLKGYPELYRVLGNLSLARVRQGDREGALEALRAALKLNPDYETARRNLHLLEPMSKGEFKRRLAEGFFEQVDVKRPLDS